MLQGAHLLLVSQRWKSFFSAAVPAVVLIYLTIVAALLMATAWRHLRLHRLVRQGRRPEAAFTALFETMRRQTGADDCELIVVPGLVSPATAFWRKPRIILPEICEEMGANEAMIAVLRHELTHVRRRDYLWSVACDVVCSLLFFHPAVWMARRRMRVERELACDEAVVIAHPEGRADYAESLTRFARLLLIEQPAETGIDFAGPASFLSKRIHAILADRQREPRWKLAARAMSGAGALAAFCLLVPALAVMMKFAPVAQASAAPQSAENLPASAALRKPELRSAMARGRDSTPVPIEETTATRMAPRWRSGLVTGAAEGMQASRESANENVAGTVSGGGWREDLPGVPHGGGTSVKGVLLQTATVIAEEGREGHTQHPGRRRLGSR
jgi:beta-lactamase regulating signal transducer with metallopeptidase domain